MTPDATSPDDHTANTIRAAFVRGWRESGHHYVSPQRLDAAPDAVERAYLDGLRLREAWNLMVSANGADYPTDLDRFERIQAEAGLRYGDGFVASIISP
jgi:hypothetical protein